ncbi:hypothetical protein ACIGXM_10805 [Kitasatospora sp. NPDC052896]|uniref:hypothetical protein n=1 Tax=Kitasatospora sp. NPDC052896 TaxID=3364061 RepID=UPI0037CA1169
MSDAIIPDGLYTIGFPDCPSYLTAMASDRPAVLLPLEPDLYRQQQWTVRRERPSGAYVLHNRATATYLRADEAATNQKVVCAALPAAWRISGDEDKYVITFDADEQGDQEGQALTLGMALERIYPPMVALQPALDPQPWAVIPID